jgi:hypothetical protein
MPTGSPWLSELPLSMAMVAVVAAIFIMFWFKLARIETHIQSAATAATECHHAEPWLATASRHWHYFVRGGALEKTPQRRQYRTNESGVKIHQT